MSSKNWGGCGVSLTGTLSPAPKGALTEADLWSACHDLRKAIPQVIELINHYDPEGESV